MLVDVNSVLSEFLDPVAGGGRNSEADGDLLLFTHLASGAWSGSAAGVYFLFHIAANLLG